MPLPPVSWSIDGLSTPLQGWSAGTTAFGGFSQMRGVIEESSARRYPSSVTQGSVVRGTTADGSVMYQGRLSAPPAIRGGLASFAAQGESVRAAKKTGRLLYQSQDGSQWFDRAGAPLFNLQGAVGSMSIEPGRILWEENQGSAATPGDAKAAGFWAQGSPGGITRLAFIHKAHFPSARQYDIFRTDNWPADTGYTLLTSFAEASTDTARDTGVIAAPQSGILIQRHYTGGASVYGEGRAHVFNIRVNGIATGDVFYGSQVVTDAGGRLGYDTSGVTSSALNILPLDWTSGSWAELLSYIATLEDRYWRVVEDSRLEYDEWGTKEWTVYQADGASVDLTPLELWNQVTVRYTHINGTQSQVTRTCADLGLPDPLAATGQINIWEESLADVQPNADLATAVANNLLPRVSSQRYAGRIDCVKAYDMTMRDAPYEIRAGDTVRVADWDMNQSVTLRIFEVEYTAEGVSLGIEAGVSIASMLARAGLVSARAPSTAQLPELEPVAVEVGEPSGLPSTEQQHRERFLPWPEPFKKPDWRKLR
jgi:hypothetical protein